MRKGWIIYLMGFFLMLIVGRSEALFWPDTSLIETGLNKDIPLLPPGISTNSEPSFPILGSSSGLGQPALILPPEIQNSINIVNDPLQPLVAKQDALWKLNEIYKQPELTVPFRNFINNFFSAIADDSQQAPELRSLAQSLLEANTSDSVLPPDNKGEGKDKQAATLSLPMGSGLSSDKKKEGASSENSESVSPVFSAQSSSNQSSSESDSTTSKTGVFSSLNNKKPSSSLGERVDNLLNPAEEPNLIKSEKESDTSLDLSEISAKIPKVSLSQSGETKFLLVKLLEMGRNNKIPPKALLDYVLAKDMSIENRKLALLLFPQELEILGTDEARESAAILEQFIRSEGEDMQAKELAVINLGALARKGKASRSEVISKLEEEILGLEKTDNNADNNIRNYTKTIAIVILYLIDSSQDGKITFDEITSLFKNIRDRLPRRFRVLLEDGDGKKVINLEELLRHSLSRIAKDLSFKDIDELIENIISFYSK